MEMSLSRERYEEIVDDFSKRAFLTLGDLMADEYLHGSVRRISPESPVVIVEVESEERKPGGAANVANNLRALGARVLLAGLVGEDEAGRDLLAALNLQGISTELTLTDPSRPTTLKTRVIAQRQQVVRVDRESTHAPSDQVVASLLENVQKSLPDVDGVLISDYRKGTITHFLASEIAAVCSRLNIPLIANPKPESALWFEGAAALSLNQSEAEALIGYLPTEAAALADCGAALRSRLGVDMLVITLGPRGLAYWRADGEYQHVPAHTIEVFDVAGAGDTTIAALALALVGSATPLEAAQVANHAGACAVRKLGVATVSAEELLADWSPNGRSR